MRKLQQVLFGILLMAPVLSFGQTAEEYIKKAEDCYERKDYDGTISNATQAISINPTGPAYWWRGLAYYYSKKYDQAIADYTKSIGLYNTTNKSALGTLHKLRADANFDKGNYEASAEDYLEAMETYQYKSSQQVVYKQLGISMDKLGYKKDAVDAYTKAIDATTNNDELADLYYLRGDAKRLGGSNNINEAIGDFSSAISKNDQKPLYYLRRGMARYSGSAYKDGLTDLEQSITMYKKNSVFPDTEESKELALAYIYAGIIKNKQEKYQECYDYFQLSIKNDPTNGFYYWEMGNFLASKGSAGIADNSNLSHYFNKALSYLERDENKKDCYFHYSNAEKFALRYGAAIKVANKAIEAYPDEGGYYWLRGHLYYTKKDYAKALSDYDKAAILLEKDSSELPNLYLERSNARLKQNNTAGAMKDIQSAISIRGDYYGYFSLGRFFKDDMKQNELGDGNLQKALQLSLVERKNKDTASNYIYTIAWLGDKQMAERLTTKLLVNASMNTEQLALELHNAACIYTILGNYTRALQYLDQSLAAGYDDYHHLINDRDLEPLFNMPEYKNILNKYKVPVPVY